MNRYATTACLLLAACSNGKSEPPRANESTRQEPVQAGFPPPNFDPVPCDSDAALRRLELDDKPALACEKPLKCFMGIGIQGGPAQWCEDTRGVKQARYTEYFRRALGNGPKLTTELEDGKKNGLEVRWWDAAGAKESAVEYRDGKRHGTFKAWHENGILAEAGTYSEDRPHGEWAQWNQEGKLLGRFKMIHGSGSMVRWHENGKMSWRREYKDGQLDGLVEGWEEDGTKTLEGNYRAGKKDGTWKYWSPSGELERREQYRDGTRLDAEEDAPPASRTGR